LVEKVTGIVIQHKKDAPNLNFKELVTKTHIGWVTDVHLDFIDRVRMERFYEDIMIAGPDALLIGGDIDDAPHVDHSLRLLGDLVPVPIYYVFGNHDFYRGSIAGVRGRIIRLIGTSSSLHWLPQAGVVPLTENTCLVGHDSWADARFGDYENPHQ